MPNKYSHALVLSYYESRGWIQLSQPLPSQSDHLRETAAFHRLSLLDSSGLSTPEPLDLSSPNGTSTSFGRTSRASPPGLASVKPLATSARYSMASAPTFAPIQSTRTFALVKPTPRFDSVKPSSTYNPVKHSPTLIPIEPSRTLEQSNPLPIYTSVNHSPTSTPVNQSRTLDQVKPSPTYTPLKYSPTLTPLKYSPTLTPVEPSRTLDQSNHPPTYVPVKHSPTLTPVKPFRTLDQVKPSPTYTPVKHFPTLAPVKPTPTLDQVRPSPTSDPDRPSPLFAPVKPSTKFIPVNSSPTLIPVKPPATINPVKHSPTLIPVKPATMFTPVKPSPPSLRSKRNVLTKPPPPSLRSTRTVTVKPSPPSVSVNPSPPPLRSTPSVITEIYAPKYSAPAPQESRPLSPCPSHLSFGSLSPIESIFDLDYELQMDRPTRTAASLNTPASSDPSLKAAPPSGSPIESPILKPIKDFSHNQESFPYMDCSNTPWEDPSASSDMFCLQSLDVSGEHEHAHPRSPSPDDAVPPPISRRSRRGTLACPKPEKSSMGFLKSHKPRLSSEKPSTEGVHGIRSPLGEWIGKSKLEI